MLYIYRFHENERKEKKLEIFVCRKRGRLAFYHVPVIAGKDVHTKNLHLFLISYFYDASRIEKNDKRMYNNTIDDV
jgi:hypothetical protein